MLFSLKKFCFILLIFLVPNLSEAKNPDLTVNIVNQKIEEILKSHASFDEINSTLIIRMLGNFLEELDPNKLYFLEGDIQNWLTPSDALVECLVQDFKGCRFNTFVEIHKVMVKAIERRRWLDRQIDPQNLPNDVKPEEFKEMPWAKSTEELLTRLKRIKALQLETARKLNPETQELSFQRMTKRQTKRELEILSSDPGEKEKYILTHVLKAFASAMDSHTTYLTPEEATQFMITVQQRLFGIGAQLRDDLDGFSVVKIIEGGPAALGKELKNKDKIIAVNGEPVVGMDIVDAVELIRGKENTPVTLTVIRPDDQKEEKLDITIMRQEVILKETRFETRTEPFGDGTIGYLKLYSFYQDPDYSSASDLKNEIETLKKNYNLKGVILDLRNNSGGLLSQAIEVAGLFITKGVIVSIKDNRGNVQHLRNVDGKFAWDGPLIILVNRVSASASEIVSQTLQDYGRAIIVGDEHTFGKGSFQVFTLNASGQQVNPQGEYKVTKGRYYTVSGKTPQLVGVQSDIVLPGALSELDIGEKFAKYPLENDSIKPNFDDNLEDIPFYQRDRIKTLYKFNLQQVLTTYNKYVPLLKKNSQIRIDNNKNYQNFLKEIKKKEEIEEEENEEFGQNDLQLTEAYNVMKDLLYLLENEKQVKDQEQEAA